MALPIARLFDFQPQTVIVSSEIDQEFNQLVSTINDLPEKDGSLQANLNADLLDGYHASTTGGTDTVPVCKAGNIQTNLNADLLDGLHATDIAAAAFDAGTKMLFYQANPPGGWTEVAKPTDHTLGWKSGQAGGTTAANSWIVSGFTITVDEHVLTVSELAAHSHGIGTHQHGMDHTHSVPAHTHGISKTKVGWDSFLVLTAGSTHEFDLLNVGSGGYMTATDPTTVTSATNANTNSGGAGTTGASSKSLTDAASGSTATQGSNSGHDHTASASQDGTWRPPTAYIIIASKD